MDNDAVLVCGATLGSVHGGLAGHVSGFRGNPTVGNECSTTVYIIIRADFCDETNHEMIVSRNISKQ